MDKINVAYYEEFQSVYFKKDVFLYPYYIAKVQGRDLHYFYGMQVGRTDIPTEHRGVPLHNYRNSNKGFIPQFINLLRCMVFPARRIDTVFLCHTGHENMLATILFKLINPKGHVVLMADMDEELAIDLTQHSFVYSGGVVGFLKHLMVKHFFCSLDVISGEKKRIATLLNDMIKRNKWTSKAVTVHPCLDEETFRGLGLQRIPYQQKEKAFITVGRIGSYQKNTEMMLDALAQVDLKDWKFYLVGPMMNGFNPDEPSEFQEKIDNFFAENPGKKNSVIFIGEVTDSKTLYEYYIRSRVFVLTSRFEGFANVTADAAAMGCYFVGTDVGGMTEMSNNWQFGSKVNQEDAKGLAAVLQSIINDELVIDPQKELSMERLSWWKMIKDNVLPELNDK